MWSAWDRCFNGHSIPGSHFQGLSQGSTYFHMVVNDGFHWCSRSSSSSSIQAPVSLSMLRLPVRLKLALFRPTVRSEAGDGQNFNLLVPFVEYRSCIPSGRAISGSTTIHTTQHREHCLFQVVQYRFCSVENATYSIYQVKNCFQC